jgi:hypothetical protein
VIFGRSLQHLANTEFRFELFCNIASEVTKFGSKIDYEAAHRCYQLFDDAEGHDRPCRCGEPTFEGFLKDPKIDYIFLTGRH